MLHIGYLIICEGVIQDKNQTIIKKPLAALTPISLPGNYSFTIAFSLHNFENETFGKNNDLRMVLKDNKERIIIDTGKLNIKGNYRNSTRPDKLEVLEADVNFNNIVLYEEGEYTLTLELNDDNKSINVPVIKKPNAGDDID